MPLVINTNTSALNAQRNLGKNTDMLSKSLERLSSGYRINRAGDDAAGLQLSEALRTQIRGSKKAMDNTQDGTNFLNIADGAFQTIQDNLQRLRELAVQAANDTYATAQRSAMALEINQLRDDIDRIANSTTFNGVFMLTTGVPANFYIQVGPNGNNTNDRIDITAALGDVRVSTVTGLNLATAVTAGNFTDNTAIQAYIGTIDSAISVLTIKRGNLGAYVNRLASAAQNLSVSIENAASAESRIRNVDVAEESTELSRNQILQQSAASILSQANQTPSLALSLIRPN